MLSLAAAQAGAPTRFGEVVFSRGEVAGQAFITAQAEFSTAPPAPDEPPLGECQLSSGVLRSREIDAEAFGAEAGEQGQEAPISAGDALNVEAGGRTLLSLEASGPAYRLVDAGPSELLRRIGGVAGPLPPDAVLEVPGQAGDYGFPAFRVPLPEIPVFVWQSPDTLQPGDTLRWSGASHSAQARVKMLLRQGEGVQARNVICAVPDTGTFVLPPAVRPALSGPLQVVGSFRTFTQVTRQASAELRVVLEEGGLH
ncbi:hypothetical protein [Deinococcus irradiatisoli]|nr:hypothetical protein [Deinococcus irradiatisoli]